MAGTASVALTMVRALFEGEPATLDVLAMASGRSEPALRRIAEREGWRAPAETGDVADIERRLLLLSDRLVGELEKASVEGERSGVYDKARIDALSAMLRMVEKLGETARSPQSARENQTRSDEDMAAALERIDARIVELAGELAARLGAPEPAGAAGAGD